MNSFLGSIGHRVILFSLFDLSSSSVLYESLNAMGSITEKFVFRFFFFFYFIFLTVNRNCSNILSLF